MLSIARIHAHTISISGSVPANGARHCPPLNQGVEPHAGLVVPTRTFYVDSDKSLNKMKTLSKDAQNTGNGTEPGNENRPLVIAGK